LVPVPEVDTLEALNERLAAIDEAENDRHVHGSSTSVGFNFAVEAELLAPLPDDDFECGITLTPTVRRDSRIVVRQCYYSVPARFIGRQVRISLRANELLVFDGNRVVARHPRLTRRYDYRDELDHYLEILMVRPGALAGSTGLAQARAAGTFTDIHDAFWAAARAAHGDAAGTRALIEVLLLHRRMPPETVLAGITAALQAGSSSPQLVAIEARKAERPAQTLLDEEDLAELAELAGLPGLSALAGTEPKAGEHSVASDTPATNVISNVITLPQRSPVHDDLHDDLRPLPSVAVYDQLLRLRNPKGTP
jgi:hypothetical protein